METFRFQQECLIFGCGNPLFGDDGFGPAVVRHLDAQNRMPPGILALDVGTSVRDILFDIILSPKKPRQIIIIDAVDLPDRMPGEIFEIAVADIAPAKCADYSLHQFPTTNMLREIKEQTDIDLRLLAGQIAYLPAEVAPGLSPELARAVPPMAERVLATAAAGLEASHG